MRMLLAVVLSALLMSMVSAQSKLVQTFEAVTFPPTGWTESHTGTLYWERIAIGGYGSSSGSAIFRFFQASGSEIQSLITSTFPATVSGDSLKFDHAYATYLTEVDSLIIETSVNDGSSYVRLVALAGGPTVGTGMVTAPPNFDDFVPTAAQWATKRYAVPAGTNKMRFTAKSAFGNNLYLDNIRVGQEYLNDVSVSGILAPRSFINMPFSFVPRATIVNVGTSNQTTPFTITMVITGPGGYSYSNTKTDTLSSGSSRQVTFASATSPTVAGSYSVACYTNLPSDQSRSNDTATTSVTAANFNFGTGSQLYCFTNSLAGSGAPAQPSFSWRDTTGSVDLIVNGTAVQPVTDDIDDGYFTIVNLFPGKHFRLFGKSYSDTVYISTNGIISFKQGFGYGYHQPPDSIPNGPAPNAAVYALWTDLDFSNPSMPGNKLSFKIDGDLLVVTYSRAPRFTFEADSNDFVSFQVCMRYSSDTTYNSFVSVQFDSSRTGSSFYTGYTNNTFRHLVGIENEAGTEAIRYRHVNSVLAVPGPVFGSSVALTVGPSYASEVQLLLKAYLEGPYSTSAHRMLTQANPLLPLTQPFGISPWSYTGLENAIAMPDSAVDWVFVELRTGTGGTSEMARSAGLLMRNGSIRQPNGTSPLKFELVPPANYYTTIAQRNHLPIMSSGALSLATIPILYDFSTAQSQAFGIGPMNQLETGVFGMVAGDIDRSSAISAADISSVLNATQTTGYTLQDVNLTGIVSTSDANLTIGNRNRSSQVPSGPLLLVENSPRVILDPHPTVVARNPRGKYKTRIQK